MVDKSEKIEWLARLGYAVRGVVYALFGYLALSSASNGQVEDGTRGALDRIQDIPGGVPLLYLCALGLLGYALYKVIVALFDTEHMGHDAKAVVKRVAYGGSAVVYAGLALTALQLAIGSRSDASDRSQEMAATALSFNFGPFLLGLFGLCLMVAAFVQAKSAVTAGFMKHISAAAPAATCWIGRAGIGARAIVFFLMGWSVVRSGWFADSDEVRSLGSALVDLRDQGVVFTIVAIGITLFGVFSLITSRYRIIADPDPKLGQHGNKLKAMLR